MDNNYLQHYGILGMRWGIRKSKPATLGKRNKLKKDKENVNNAVAQKKRTVKDLSDNELRERINRLELEKRYRDLSSSNTKNNDKGKAFVMDVLEKSGKNIAIQFTTYVMGKGVNKAFSNLFDDDAIVNPKKGQKDK